jgi:hypothetical protein
MFRRIIENVLCLLSCKNRLQMKQAFVLLWHKKASNRRQGCGRGRTRGSRSAGAQRISSRWICGNLSGQHRGRREAIGDGSGAGGWNSLRAAAVPYHWPRVQHHGLPQTQSEACGGAAVREWGSSVAWGWGVRTAAEPGNPIARPREGCGSPLLSLFIYRHC